jgi:hypothetical protein
MTKASRELMQAEWLVFRHVEIILYHTSAYSVQPCGMRRKRVWRRGGASSTTPTTTTTKRPRAAGRTATATATAADEYATSDVACRAVMSQWLLGCSHLRAHAQEQPRAMHSLYVSVLCTFTGSAPSVHAQDSEGFPSDETRVAEIIEVDWRPDTGIELVGTTGY